ncbi:MAG: haloacid dehalogenase-like hydrolase [Terracidiphilus sp.]|nr:haloacid dehalogenase-like hydrolase [Terracidiphilus sp.]
MESVQWTAPEFERLVLEGQPKVAVFDCDGTLWGGDSGYGFMVWSLEQGLVSRSTSDWIDERYRAYRAGKVSEEAICGDMVQMYAGLQDQELHSAAAHYVAKYVTPRVFEEMDALVSSLLKAGTELWAVSSTNRWVVAEGVRVFGIPEERVLAAEVRVENGLISSDLVGVPTDEGKAEALRRAGLSQPDAVFGNSAHDLAMLELARAPFAINPSPALLDACAKRGWGHFRPAAAEGLSAAVDGE